MRGKTIFCGYESVLLLSRLYVFLGTLILAHIYLEIILKSTSLCLLCYFSHMIRKKELRAKFDAVGLLGQEISLQGRRLFKVFSFVFLIVFVSLLLVAYTLFLIYWKV